MLKRDLGNGAPDLGTDVQPDLLQDHRAVTADAVAVDHMRDLAVLAGLLLAVAHPGQRGLEVHVEVDHEVGPGQAEFNIFEVIQPVEKLRLLGLALLELLRRTLTLGLGGLLLGVIFCLILAGCIAALFAFLIGLPVLKLKSDYLAIATLGFAEIIRAAVVYEGFGPLTNGSNLLYGFTSFASFNLSLGGTTLHLETVMPFLFSGVCIAIILLLINSTYGRAFKAIRDDEIAAEAMGINLASHKRMSFIISSFFAGISGAMLAMYQASVQATTFKSSMTYEILLIVVIGGIGSVSGSIIASFLFIASSEWLLRFLDNETWIGGFRVPLLRSGFRMVVFSVIIMAVVLFFRKGIMGDRELFQKKPASAAKAAKKEVRSK